MRIRVIIPKGSLLRGKIRDTYVELYKGYCRNIPIHQRTYTRKKLRDNIRSILAVGKTYIETESLNNPILESWVVCGYKVFSYKSWKFAVIITKTKKGTVRAEIQDGCFEGDYHNDTKDTKPWDESVKNNKIVITESQLRSIIRETIRRIILSA